MRSLWIATLAATALVPVGAAAQSVSRSGASSAPGTFARATAGPQGAFSHAQSATPRANWSGPRSGPGGVRPVTPRGNIQPRPNQPGWIDTRGGVYRPHGGSNANSWSNSRSYSWSGPRGRWDGQRWNGGSRWGGRVDGRWSSGSWAPGGWNAYRRPTRGWTLPSYWFAPGFYINDFSYYGLGAPPVGYNWTRYYDDAVLIDGRGRVFDSVSGVDWDRYDGAAAYDDYADYSYDGRYDDGDAYYADGVDDDYGPRGRDNGVGGAVIGGVVGGVAGNVIAGRGNRVAGTVVGAGVGAIAGAAIDRAEDRGRYNDRPLPPTPPRGAPYPYPAQPLPPGAYPPPPVVHHGGGYETRVYQSGGYAGYGYYGGTTTTVTVLPTTTETVETVTYYDNAVTKRRTYRAPVKHRPPSKILSRSKTLSR